MSLKREIGKLEQAEQMQEEEELTMEMRQAEQRSIDEKVEGLYRRINVIVEYIDREKNEEELTREKQQREGILLQSLRASKKEITDERQMKKIIERLKENDGVTTIADQQLKEDEQHFIENGIRKAWELKNLELDLRIKNIKGKLEEQQKSLKREPLTASKEEATERVKEKDKIGLGLGKKK